MAVAAFMGMLMVFRIVNVLVLVYLSMMIVGMSVLICTMATHWLTPPIYFLK